MEVTAGSKTIALATLLGVIAFASKGFLPTPVDKMFVVIQALAFALASVLAEWGATYASVVNGVLLSMIRVGFFPFSFIFSVVYGFLIDVFFRVFKAKTGIYVEKVRLISSLTLSTAIISLLSLYVTTLLGLMPMTPILYFIILVIGILNGVAAGYLTSLIWSKYLVHHVRSRSKMVRSSWS